MNTTRRAIIKATREALSMPFAAASTSASAIETSRIAAEELPPAIFNLISRHLARKPSAQRSISIPNPFITHKQSISGSELEPSSSNLASHNRTIERAISRRREKQLLSHYPSTILPPSKLNPVPNPSVITWLDGTEVTWSGEVPQVTKKESLYSGRRLIFKGHKHERQRGERLKDTADRLKTMDKRIQEWRETKREAKTATKPQLPF